MIETKTIRCRVCMVENPDCYKGTGRLCKKCDHTLRHKRGYSALSRKNRKIHERTKAAKHSLQREAGERREYFILQDCRRWDKKHGFTCDLSMLDIAEMIAKPCEWCGGTEVKMSIDRLDNSKGHILNNVVQSCIRCNFIKGNMPLEAWLLIKNVLPTVRESGAFGDWIGRTFRYSHQKS